MARGNIRLDNLDSTVRDRYDPGGYCLTLAPPVNRTYTVDINADYPMRITKVTTKLDQGTCNVRVRINNTLVVGCSNIAATSTLLESNAVGENLVTPGDKITVQVANVAAVTDAAIKVHTVAREEIV